jgi:transposase
MVKEVANQFRVSTHVVYYWLERGIIEARRLNHGAPYWITLGAEKKNELYAWVPEFKTP